MTTTETPLLTLTESAAAKIKELIAGEPDGETAVLRVAVQGGSCAGPNYALGLDDTALEDDIASEQLGVRIVVDPFSAPYLQGATVDFVAEGDEEGFTIENPLAQSGCGCGSSYQGEGEPGESHGCGGNCSC